MCGIAGYVSWAMPPEPDRIRQMTGRLWHRGPDAGDIFVEGPAGLGHRRLAIIDVRPIANQPMVDSTGRFVIVFNGEIYNYLDLRRELEKLGAKFITDSDTEVLLEAYSYWGAGCLDRLNGMFAFAVWDRLQKRLFLARDRLGEKPLFYFPLSGGGIVFASELKALRSDPDVSRAINPRAIRQFISLNYILSSESILQGVRKLGPAQYLTVEEGRPLRPVPYWDLAGKFRVKHPFKSEGEAAEALAALVDDAVRLRLVSDVPLGAFLSGGLDSSTIIASMCRFKPPSETHTFSIGFSEPSYDEVSWARRAAEFLGVTHHDMIVSADVAAEIEQMVYSADEPFADTSFIPTYCLARFARQHVSVCLSGDGADELFAGYNTYIADKLQHLMGHFPKFLLSAGEGLATRLLPVTWRKVGLDYKIRQFLRGAAFPPPKAHYSWRTIHSQQEGLGVLAPEWAATLAGMDAYEDFAMWHRDVADCHYLDQALYMDVKTWLVDDILVKVDRATMAHSLEARVPFLDHRLVEFAASLPVSLKLMGMRKKYVLKKSQEGRLRKEIIYRSKEGFNAPIAHWIGSSLRGYVDDLMRSEKTKAFFNRSYVERLLAEHDRGNADNGLKLYGILCLGLWLRQS
jgi:asparagine synthase (glutamine-hydrolysing)